MNSSNRVWVIVTMCSVLLCFMAGLLASRKPALVAAPEATPTGILDPDFSAPHKPDINRARKTPGPEPEPLLSPSTVSSGSSSSLWVLQDGLPLYASQGLNQPILRRLPFATEVNLLEEVDEWVRAQADNGQVGWLRRQGLADRPPEGTRSNRPDQARLALEGYFEELNRKNYSRAYDSLSSDFKRDLSYRSFAAGYAGVEQIFMRVVRIQKLSAESQMFSVEILSEERPKPKAFLGEYVMVLEQARWRLGQASLRPVDPRKLDPFPARSAPLKPAFADPTPAPEDEEYQFSE